MCMHCNIEYYDEDHRECPECGCADTTREHCTSCGWGAVTPDDMCKCNDCAIFNTPQLHHINDLKKAVEEYGGQAKQRDIIVKAALNAMQDGAKNARLWAKELAKLY